MTDTAAMTYADRKVVKDLSQLQPWRTTLAIAADWLVIAAAIYASIASGSTWVYAIAVFVIAGRMHAMAVLIHDFAHYRWIRNKVVSEWVGDLLLAWPLMTTVDGYRQNHLAHHRHTNTENDPDFRDRLGVPAFTFPRSWHQVVLTFAGYAIAVRSILDIMGFLRRFEARPSPAYTCARIGFYIAVLLAFWWLDAIQGLFWYWLLPFLTAFFAIMYVRSVAEHFGSMDYDHELTGTRTVIPHLWEKAIFAPHNVNYHLDHHLYPSVPFYNLPQLHAHLMENPDFRELAHITRGYTTGVLRECLQEAADKRDAGDQQATA